MLDSLYGNLLGPAPNPQGRSEDVTAASSAVSAGPKKEADDIFAQPLNKDATPAAGKDAPEQAAKPEAAPAPSLPQAFSAAKLMMPPVRKKAEPAPGKKPMPAFDIQKLQEEKEALMRQRAAAAAPKEVDKAPSGGSSPSNATSWLGGSNPSSAVAASDDGAGLAPAASSTASLSTSLYGSPDEEYDPAKPNDYDEFCRRRMRLKAEEELEKRRQEALARQQAKTPAVAEPKEDDFATRMLKKMGWKEGAGLGKEGQGMATPLVLKKTDQKAGTIVEGAKREAPVAQPPGQPDPKQAKAAPSTRPPTRILLLNNLVGAGEVDEDLEGETAEEAGKYGKLVKCAIKEVKGVPDEQAVRIFLEYERVEDATKALVDMNGRYFGGRVVKARFFDPARFAANDLGDRKSVV